LNSDRTIVLQRCAALVLRSHLQRVLAADPSDGLACLFEAERQLDDQFRHRLVSALDERGVSVRGAYVYGSVARGERRPQDIDVALVSDEDTAPALTAAMGDIEADLSHRFGVGFHLIITNRPLEEMVRAERDPAGLWHSIAAEGRKL
jgi:predicted nucleotidyltransferase